jgi:hypothetical protein
MDACCDWNCVPDKFTTKISPTLTSGTILYIRFVQRNTVFNNISIHVDTHTPVPSANHDGGHSFTGV